MSNYKNHLVVGFLLSFIFLSLVFVLFPSYMKFILISFIVIPIFSLLPDIDHKMSKISFLLHVSIILTFVSLFFQIIPFSFGSILFFVSLLVLEIYHIIFAIDHWSHRHFSHTFTFGVACLLITYLITFSFIVTFVGFISFSSHILMDNHFSKAIKFDKIIWKKFFSIIKK